MTSEQFEQEKAKADRVKTFWQAVGCSRKGNTSKRDGKIVDCGHQHKSRHSAQQCATQMEKERPGNCQRYKVTEFTVLYFKKGKE